MMFLGSSRYGSNIMTIESFTRKDWLDPFGGRMCLDCFHHFLLAGDGSFVLFWEDNWSGDCLLDRFPSIAGFAK
jgi:hypothetical protein